VTEHRSALTTWRQLLPRRPLPFERGFSGVPPVGETRFVTTEMMFQAGPNVSPQQVDAAARRLGLTAIASRNSTVTGGTIYHFRVAPGRPVGDVVRSLEAENLGAAAPNYVYGLSQMSEQDAAQTDLAAKAGAAVAAGQYVVDKLRLGEVHQVATGSNVLIGVIDSKVDVNHPDLAGAVVEQFDAVGRPEQPHTHGTGMVGAIVAHLRLMGIAPNARILAATAFSTTTKQTPEATTRNILAGLDWAISKGARVINMSFAGPADPLLQLAMKNAAAKGVVLIAATGNSGPKSPPLYPAADPHVIGVTATDENDQLFAQAVRGAQVAVAAPGVDIMVPAPDNGYQITTGTSVASAHVSGVAALLIERYPNVDAATVLEVLTSSAKRLNPKGRDDNVGWGLIDPASALAELDARMAAGSQVASPAKSSTTTAAVAKPTPPKPPAAPKAPTGGSGLTSR
jgi:subtilisin family serine protease